MRIFSAFSGWQIANNALFVYPYVRVDSERLPTRECKELDRYIKGYFAATPLGHEPVDTWYMWNPESPLKQYMSMRRKKEHLDYFTAWNRVAPVFSRYGYYLLSRHPLLFCQKYGWPSARMYFYPPLEMLTQYNEGLKDVDPVAQSWFHYKTTRVKVYSYTIQERILAFLPGLFLLENIASVGVMLIMLSSALAHAKRQDRGRKKGRAWKDEEGFRAAMVLTAAYFVVNAAFCIFATPNTLRYQLAPLIWFFAFSLLALEKIRKKGPEKSNPFSVNI